MYNHRNRTYKLSNLPLFGVATPGVFMLSAMFARKIHCIRSGSYSVIHCTVKFLGLQRESSGLVKMCRLLEEQSDQSLHCYCLFFVGILYDETFLF